MEMKKICPAVRKHVVCNSFVNGLIKLPILFFSSIVSLFGLETSCPRSGEKYFANNEWRPKTSARFDIELCGVKVLSVGNSVTERDEDLRVLFKVDDRVTITLITVGGRQRPHAPPLHKHLHCTQTMHYLHHRFLWLQV